MKSATIDPARLNNPNELPLSVEWMTKAQWEARYPAEFVAVVDPDFDEQTGVTGGFVVHHSPERAEAYSELLRMKPKHFAVRFTGNTDDMVFLL